MDRWSGVLGLVECSITMSGRQPEWDRVLEQYGTELQEETQMLTCGRQFGMKLPEWQRKGDHESAL